MDDGCLGDCGRPPVICNECLRALALVDSAGGFASISRHPEEGTDCRVCAAGRSDWCPECFCREAAAWRQHLLDRGAHERATLEQLRSPRWRVWVQWWAWGGLHQ